EFLGTCRKNFRDKQQVHVLYCLRPGKYILDDLAAHQILAQAQQLRNLYTEKLALTTFVERYQLLGENIADVANLLPPQQLCLEVALQAGLALSEIHFSKERATVNEARGARDQPRFVFLKKSGRYELDRRKAALLDALLPKIAYIKSYVRGKQAKEYVKQQRSLARKIQALTRAWCVRHGRRKSEEAKNLLVGSCLLLRLRIRDWWLERCATRLQANF
ncbi:unnamed protein product, partial [Amoebophrya sp. A120]